MACLFSSEYLAGAKLARCASLLPEPKVQDRSLLSWTLADAHERAAVVAAGFVSPRPDVV